MSSGFPAPRQLRTPRGRFAVRDFGQGPPLVMLHGWPQSSHCWKPVSAFLADRYRLILPDLRGLGDSERTPGVAPYRKDELARDIGAVLDGLSVDRFHLVGHDWGGAVAQELVLQRPTAIRRLALLNICIIVNRRGNREAQSVLNARGNRVNWYQHFQQAEGLAEALIPGNEAAWVRFFLDGVPEPAVEEYVRCYAQPGTAASAAGLYRSFPEDIRRWERGPSTLPVEALYIYGNRDRVVIREFLEDAENCFDSLRIEELDAGHFVPEERPEHVSRLLREFMD